MTDVCKRAKKMYRKQLKEDLKVLDKIESIDALYVLMYGQSKTNIWGMRSLKQYVSDPKKVKESCLRIDDVEKKEDS